jgi:hypothetical protein
MTNQSLHSDNHLPIYAWLRSFTYRWRLCRERTERIKRAVAHEQLHAAALVEKGTKRRAMRIGFWADQVAATEPLG